MLGPGNKRPLRIERHSVEQYRDNADAVKKSVDNRLDQLEYLEGKCDELESTIAKQNIDLAVLRVNQEVKRIPYIIQCFCSVIGTILICYGVNLITTCQFTTCQSELNGTIPVGWLPSGLGALLLLASLLIPLFTTVGGK